MYTARTVYIDTRPSAQHAVPKATNVSQSAQRGPPEAAAVDGPTSPDAGRHAPWPAAVPSRWRPPRLRRASAARSIARLSTQAHGARPTTWQRRRPGPIPHPTPSKTQRRAPRAPNHRTAATEVADRCAGMSRRLCWSAHGRLRCTMQPFDIHVQNQRPSCCASTPGAAGVLLWIRKWSRIKRPRNAIRNALRIAPIACAPP